MFAPEEGESAPDVDARCMFVRYGDGSRVVNDDR